MATLNGPEILIRPLELSDITEEYVAWLEDPEVNQYLETKYKKQTISTVTEFVRSKINRKNEILMAICLRDSQRHIGNIKLGPINSDHHTADVSLFIGEKDCWGKGYAAQAIYLISSFAIEEKGVQKLKAGCYSENIGSAKAFEKCGYVREGIFKEAVLHHGKRIDSWVYGVLPNELIRPWSN